MLYLGNRLRSLRWTVDLTTSAIVAPPASRIALMFSSVRVVCSSIVVPTTLPVTGSTGPCPETNTKSPTRSPCEYAPPGLAALSVRISCLGIAFLLECPELARLMSYEQSGSLATRQDWKHLLYALIAHADQFI